VVPPPPDIPVSGLAHTEYYLNHWPWMWIPTEYTGPFTVGHGIHTLHYRSHDQAGNTEPYKQTSFCVNDFEAGMMREEARMLAALKEVIALRLRKDFASTLPIVKVRFDYGALVGQGEPDWVTLGTDTNGDDGWEMIWDTVAAKIPDGQYLLRMTAYGPEGFKPMGGFYPLEDQPIYTEKLTVTVCNIPDSAYLFELAAPAEADRGGSIEYSVVFQNRAEQPLSKMKLLCDLDPGLFEKITVQDGGSLDGKGMPNWYKEVVQKEETWKVHFTGITQQEIRPGTVITVQCMVQGDPVAQLLSDDPATQQEKDYTAVTVRLLNGVIRGTVADASKAEPLSATVTAAGPKQYTALTDSKGRFLLDDLVPGTYTLTVSAPGYIYSAPSGPPDLPVGGTGKTVFADFYMTARDGIPPVSALELSVKALVDGNLARIRGTARDEMPGSGVDKVEVRVQRRKDLQYWNGENWGKDEKWLPAEGTTDWTCFLGDLVWDPAHVYAVSTRATDNAGNVESPRVNTKTAGLPAPHLLSPLNGAVVTAGSGLAWSQVIDCFYHIQIDNDGAFGSPEMNAAYLSGNEITPQNIGKGRFYWRVKAQDWEKGELQSAWSEIRTFIIPLAGDLDAGGAVGLHDAILGLQFLGGLKPGSDLSRGGDVNGDGRIGLEEVIYILQWVSRLR